jgi:undecaprenyl pyrophosphate synthase
MTGVLWACAFVLGCIAFYRFGLPWLKQFDARNVARKEREERDKFDRNAHIRHALEVAEEQVEEIQEIKIGDITHYLFEAEVFATRDEAEETRARRIGVVARRFYDELPAALMSRGEPRSNLSARERASKRWKRTIH